MTAPYPGDGLAAALIQLADHTERITSLDSREDTHYQQVAARLRDLGTETAAATSRLVTVQATLARHAFIVNALDGLDAQVAELARQLAGRATAGNGENTGYQPVAAPRWWQVRGPDRDSATGRLRAWVNRIYRPGYGKISAALPPCWEQHPLCLYTLDWLSELWSALYLTAERDGRTLAAQAEWQTRLLPAAAEQMAYDAAGCEHARSSPPRPAGDGSQAPPWRRR